MSFPLLTLLRTREDITGPAKAILFVLADRADEHGECWIGHAKIAAEAGLGKSTVKKHLQTLKHAGEITWTQRFTGDGDRDSNLYKITLGGRPPDSLGRLSHNPPPPPGGGGVGHEVAEGRPPRGYKAPIEANKDKKSSPEVSPEGIQFAQWFKSTLPASTSLSGNWQESFAKAHDDLVRLDKRSPEEIRQVCQWARTDSFWQGNFMTPCKLRTRKDGITYFDLLAAKMKPGSGLKSKFAGTQQPELQMPT